MIAANLIERARAVPCRNVANGHVRHLKANRRYLIGPCPVCGGTDRFSINRQKNLWNCRGCQKGGGVIDLVQHLQGLSFPAAIATQRRPIGQLLMLAAGSIRTLLRLNHHDTRPKIDRAIAGEKKAYLVLTTWPNGSNVAIIDDENPAQQVGEWTIKYLREPESTSTTILLNTYLTGLR